jgi:hypothetical protein
MYSTAVVCLCDFQVCVLLRFLQVVVAVGASYAAVPLYRMFCAATGFAGTPNVGTGRFEPERLVPMENSPRIKVHFNADKSEQLPWTFTPQQKFVTVLPGETSLAFYTAKNPSDKDIIGIATYNVTPDRVRSDCSKHMVLNSHSGCTIFFKGRVFLLRRTASPCRRRSRYASAFFYRQGYPRRSVVSKYTGYRLILYLLSVCPLFVL